jgi:hypothetical protein
VPSPEQTDALYDVLGAARALMAAQLRMERAHISALATIAVEPDEASAKATDSAAALALEFEDALQRLRDTLFETRALLLGSTRDAAPRPRCGAVDSFEPDGGATCELDAGHEDRWHKAGHKTWTDFERREFVERAA